MLHIEIEEVENQKDRENGFVVDLFDSDGPSGLDRTVFCHNIEEVVKTVEKFWNAQLHALEKTEMKQQEKET